MLYIRPGPLERAIGVLGSLTPRIPAFSRSHTFETRKRPVDDEDDVRLTLFSFMAADQEEISRTTDPRQYESLIGVETSSLLLARSSKTPLDAFDSKRT